ncbi:beta-amyrin synthase-like [Neltuma alba]|uniref:beta-amyrin synthase-like n=1 Tax=Neltuma alba TaxID=207710 RepID=UPI0010A5186E|nr:beta-amyrin synthase-like [Prosopis alba]
MKYIRYENEITRYITSSCVEKAFCMAACWAEDPKGDAFKKHIARSLGSQTWDASFAIQALISTNLIEEIAPTLARGLYFMKQSQVQDNPSGDFKSMYRHISKGTWTFSVADQALQVSDSAEGLKNKNNGGVAAWEPIKGQKWLEVRTAMNTVEFFEDSMVEHETVECTGSAVQALVLFGKFYPTQRRKEIENFIENGVRFIEDTQTEDGSWWGFWGICFTYGTMFALAGLAAAGKTHQNSNTVRKAEYIPLEGNRSHVVQTAWAMMGLIHSGQMKRPTNTHYKKTLIYRWNYPRNYRRKPKLLTELPMDLRQTRITDGMHSVRNFSSLNQFATESQIPSVISNGISIRKYRQNFSVTKFVTELATKFRTEYSVADQPQWLISHEFAHRIFCG